VGAEAADDEHLLLPDLVMHDLERPRALERLVQALDHAVALHVVEQPVAPPPLADLLGRERLLQQRSVHRLPPPLGWVVSNARSARAASRVSSRSSPSASSLVSRSIRSASTWTA